MRAFLATLAAALLLAAFGATSASATELITNGGFETGTLSGWHVSSETGEGKWFAYGRQMWEEGEVAFPPPSGNYAAADSFEEPDSVTLSQEVALPANSTDELSMLLGYSSSAPMSAPPTTSLATTGANEFQYVRVDVLRAGSPLDTLQPSDVLKTIYATDESSPEELAPQPFTADLSSLAGQTVTLRIANLVERDTMNLVVDDVSIESKPMPVVAP